MSLIALASNATTRKRVFQRFALGPDRIDGLAHEIAVLRIAAYEGRLAQLANAMGLNVQPSLYESNVLGKLQQDARDTAFGVIHTHNDDLRAFLAQQPRGLAQSELARRVQSWEGQRQDWKSQQIAVNEGYTAANQADRDVIKRNKIQTRMRVEPNEAKEPNCQELIDRGWMRESDVDFDLPLHIGCQHAFSYQESLADAVSDKDQVWLGDWYSMETKLQDDSEDKKDATSGTSDDTSTGDDGSSSDDTGVEDDGSDTSDDTSDDIDTSNASTNDGTTDASGSDTSDTGTTDGDSADNGTGDNSDDSTPSVTVDSSQDVSDAGTTDGTDSEAVASDMGTSGAADAGTADSSTGADTEGAEAGSDSTATGDNQNGTGGGTGDDTSEAATGVGTGDSGGAATPVTSVPLAVPGRALPHPAPHVSAALARAAVVHGLAPSAARQVAHARVTAVRVGKTAVGVAVSHGAQHVALTHSGMASSHANHAAAVSAVRQHAGVASLNTARQVTAVRQLTARGHVTSVRAGAVHLGTVVSHPGAHLALTRHGVLSAHSSHRAAVHAVVHVHGLRVQSARPHHRPTVVFGRRVQPSPVPASQTTPAPVNVVG